MEPREAEVVAAIGVVAFAGLARTLGCPIERINDLYDEMADYMLPADPTEAVSMMQRGMVSIGITDLT